jgi:hypothetical protein
MTTDDTIRIHDAIRGWGTVRGARPADAVIHEALVCIAWDEPIPGTGGVGWHRVDPSWTIENAVGLLRALAA